MSELDKDIQYHFAREDAQRAAEKAAREAANAVQNSNIGESLPSWLVGAAVLVGAFFGISE